MNMKTRYVGLCVCPMRAEAKRVMKARPMPDADIRRALLKSEPKHARQNPPSRRRGEG